MTTFVEQTIQFEIESLKTEVQQLKKHFKESIQVNQLAIQRVNMIDEVHQFIEQAKVNQRKFFDDLEQMKSRMDTFEKSNRRIDHSLKELSRRSSAAKKTGGTDTNFTTLESIRSGMQSRQLTSAKNNEARSSSIRNGPTIAKLKSKMVPAAQSTHVSKSPSKKHLFAQTMHLDIPNQMKSTFDQPRSSHAQPRRKFTDKNLTEMNIRGNSNEAHLNSSMNQMTIQTEATSRFTVNPLHQTLNPNDLKQIHTFNDSHVPGIQNNKTFCRVKNFKISEMKKKIIKMEKVKDDKPQVNRQPLLIKTRISSNDQDSSALLSQSSSAQILDYQYTPHLKNSEF